MSVPTPTEVRTGRLGRHLVLLLLAQVCALFLRSWLEIALNQRGVANATHLSYLVVPLVLMTLLYPLLRQHRTIVHERFKLQQLTWELIGTAFLLGILLRLNYWCLQIVLGVIRLPRFDGPLVNEMPFTGFECPSVVALLSLIIVHAMLTPVVEEVINRGLILHWFLTKGRWLAIVVSSFLFAIFHEPENIPFAFVFGLLAAVYVLNTGNLWGAVITHATFNGLIALDWLCFQIVWQPSGQSAALVRVAACAFLICIATTIAGIRIVRKRTTEL